MDRMQTRTDSFAPVLNWLDPFGSWDAAARWNGIASEWMTKGWRQWLELVTVWPALEPGAAAQAGAPAVIPAKAGTQEARDARELDEQAQAHAHDSRVRRNEGSRRTAAPRRNVAKRTEHAAAKAAPKRPAAKRPARPQAAARSTRSRG